MLLRNIFSVKVCIILTFSKLTAKFEFLYLAFHLRT